jgi:hypothetical protein
MEQLLRERLQRKAHSEERARTCSGKRDGVAFEHRHAHISTPLDVTHHTCKTPILNSRVAGLCAAASIPMLIHVRVSSGSITASNQSREAA